MSTPHDVFFRDVWARKDIAEDFLRNYLPEPLVDQFRWETLKPRSESFVKTGRKKQFSDLLFEVRRADRDAEALVYVLFEHKSYPDPHVTVQLLRYMAAIWEQYLEERSGGDRQLRELPPIIPLVFYHGARGWQPRRLGELIQEGSDALAAYVPDFQFVFANFSGSVTPEFRGRAVLQAILRLLQAVPAGKLAQELQRVMPLLRELMNNADGMRLFERIVKYMLQVDETVTMDEVRKAARIAISSTAEDVTMTIAEQLRQEGRQEGGLDVLRRQLETRFGTIPPRYEERLAAADSLALLRWSERILTAQTIDEVFSQ